LAEVQFRFDHWRKIKKHRERIPEDLWTAAVLLNREHSIHKISRTLKLSYADLKKRVSLSKKKQQSIIGKQASDFIPIDISLQHSAECLVEMEHRNGNRMRMHFKGQAELDLQSFAESFWNGKK